MPLFRSSLAHYQAALNRVALLSLLLTAGTAVGTTIGRCGIQPPPELRAQVPPEAFSADTENLFLVGTALTIGPPLRGVIVDPPATARSSPGSLSLTPPGTTTEPLTLVGASFSLLIFDQDNALLSSLEVDHHILDITAQGEFAYLACDESGVLVVDFGDPTAPEVVDTLGVSQACAVAIGDNLLCGASYQGHLSFYDLADPGHPDYTGGHYTGRIVLNAVAAEADLFYVVGDYCPLYVIDASDPTNPYEIGSLTLYATGYDVAAAGDHVVVACGTSIRTISVADPTHPREVGTLHVGGKAVRVAGDYAYVADPNRGLSTIDISSPTTPRRIDVDRTGGTPQGVAVGEQSVALMTKGGGSIYFFDRSDPTDPEELGNFQTADEAEGITVAGHHAYVADHKAGLLVLDISDPIAPTLVGGWHGCYRAVSVTVAGDLAYLCDLNQGLIILDVSDPALPVPIGGLPITMLRRVVLGADNVLYGAATLHGLLVIDVADPSQPTLLNTLDFAVRDLALQGDQLCATGRSWLLSILDVTIPREPQVIGNYDNYSWGQRVGITDDIALVADYEGGLVLLDISNPAVPMELSHWEPYYKVKGIDIAPEGVYLARRIDGYSVLDISDPTDPVEIAHFHDEITGDANDIVVASTFAFTAAGQRGVLVLNPVLGQPRYRLGWSQ